MSSVRPVCCALATALLLSACAGSSQPPTSNETPALRPTPADAPISDNPFLDDLPADSDSDRTGAGGDLGSADPACEHKFKLDLFVAGTGDRPDWYGHGRLRVNPCVSPFADHDGEMRVRLPDVNRGVNVRMHKQEDSTETERHYVGRKLAGKGGDSQASLVMWEIDARVTNHSVHPYVRTNGSVTRLRTRWFLNRDGSLSQSNDELVATFTGVPTPEQEPKKCKDL
ncbi:MAG: hypothetical protein GEEBNDBF_01160 [bacterium]|nr:hypothetical protein [bacterium]